MCVGECAATAAAAEHAQDQELRVVRGAVAAGHEQEAGRHEGEVRDVPVGRSHSAADLRRCHRPRYIGHRQVRGEHRDTDHFQYW